MMKFFFLKKEVILDKLALPKTLILLNILYIGVFNFNPNLNQKLIFDIEYGKYTLDSSNPTRGSKSISERILMRRHDQ